MGSPSVGAVQDQGGGKTAAPRSSANYNGPVVVRGQQSLPRPITLQPPQPRQQPQQPDLQKQQPQQQGTAQQQQGLGSMVSLNSVPKTSVAPFLCNHFLVASKLKLLHSSIAIRWQMSS